MGALVNVFKSLFGGILGFFGGLVGGKKKAIDAAPVEAIESEAVKAKPAKAKKAKKNKDGFYAEAEDSMLEELPAANAAVEVDAKGKKVKATPAKAGAKVAAPLSGEELIIAALKLNQSPAEKAAEAAAVASAAVPTAGFATQYMVPTLTSGRRTPGPSMKGFKTMAKEIRG